MDWKSFGISALAVYALMLVSGTIISLISTFFQCSKTQITESLKQGSIFATFPTIIYLVGRYFEFVRAPFSNALQSYFPGVSDVVGLGWLMVFSLTLPATVWNIHQSEKNVCAPDVNEMALFKKKMLAELQSKEEAKEKSANQKL
jgi:hypothetical protein